VLGCREVEHLIIVAPASHVDQCWAAAGRPHADSGSLGVNADHCRVDVVVGGADRSASVKAGLLALSHDDEIVLVHDVARCLAPPDVFERVLGAVRAGHPAVVPGLPVSDTVKVVDGKGEVLRTPDRASLRGIQTPQGFLREVLEDAHAQSQTSGGAATDDAGLVEQTGRPVRVVLGDHRALKITSPFDLTIATALLQGGPHVR
jgi:2-C-methyl-D-erythritol 4-phosphate cytidylyltransferase